MSARSSAYSANRPLSARALAASAAAAAHPSRPPSTPAGLFAAQYGLASDRQLLGAGVTARALDIRVEVGDWLRYSPGVIRLGGSPDDWRQAAMATTLGTTRAAVTGPLSLRLRAIDGFADARDLLVVSYRGDEPRLPTDASLWTSRRLTPDDVMYVDGIRCTILPTALVHAAPSSDATAFGKAVDDLLRRDVSPAWVQSVADRWRGRGVPGSGILTAALAERCDKRLPKSWFERLARRALQRHGFTFEHELPVFEGGRRLAVLDLAALPLQVGVECQSWAWHATPAARAANARRKRRLTRLGWDIVELWWSDLHRMDEVVEDVTAAFDRQARLRA